MTGRGRVIRRDEIERSELHVRRLSEPEPARVAETQASLTIEPPEPQPAPEDDHTERVRRMVQAMLSGVAQQRRELLAELQPYVVRIAVEVARRIVRRELTVDPGLITRTAEVALEQMMSASQITVRVHPLDAQVLHATLSEIVPAPDRAEALEIVPDGSIEPGGCVVESDRGIVDARLRTQFEAMQARLLAELDGGGGRA